MGEINYREILSEWQAQNLPKISLAIVSTITLSGINRKNASFGKFVFSKYKRGKKSIGLWEVTRDNFTIIREITRAAARLGADKIFFVSEGKTPDGNTDATVHLITDHINVSGKNPLIGPNDESCGTRFPDMSGLYNSELNDRLEKRLKAKRFNCRRSICLITRKKETLSMLERKIIETQKDIVISTGMGMGPISAKHISATAAGIVLSGDFTNLKQGFVDKILLKIVE
jgi:hypothetical protein